MSPVTIHRAALAGGPLCGVRGRARIAAGAVVTCEECERLAEGMPPAEALASIAAAAARFRAALQTPPTIEPTLVFTSPPCQGFSVPINQAPENLAPSTKGDLKS